MSVSRIHNGGFRDVMKVTSGARICVCLLLAALLIALPGMGAEAQGRPSTARKVDRGHKALEAECARLRADLAKRNAEIGALKRARRTLANSYRMREKMADAELLARRLTEKEGELRRLRGEPPVAVRPAWSTATAALAPGDGPLELEAKADLLSDQARRLNAEAEAMASAAERIRSRHLLRRRANDFERDPFVGLEASRRNMAFSKNLRVGAPPGTQANSNSTNPSTPDLSGVPLLGDGRSSTVPKPPTQSAPLPTSPTTGEVSLQARALLDPATLAEVQRLERSGEPFADAAALEKAAEALRAQSRLIDEQAKRLREQAKQ